MTKLMDKALARVHTWPADRQDEVAQLLLALDAIGADPIEVDEETLAAIDEGLADIVNGNFADPAEIEAVFARELARKAAQDWLGAEVQKGIDEADRDELIPAEEVFASLRAEIAARARA